MGTSLGEGKTMNLNLLKSAKNWPSVASCSCGG